MTNIPEHWTLTSISQITEKVETTDPRKSPTCQFAYVDIGAIDNVSRKIVSPKTFLGADAPSRARRVISAGDTLFSTVRTYLKNIAQVPAELEGQLTSTGIAVLRPGNAVTPEYLFKWVQHSEFVDQISKSQDGTMYPAVSDRDVADGPIPLPPLPEQRRIVAKLDRLSARSAAARDHLAHTTKLATRAKQAILASFFSDEASTSWDHDTVNEVIEETLVGLVRSKSQQSESGTPYIRMNHFDLSGTWNQQNLTHVEVSQTESDRYELHASDLLFNTRNSSELVGKVALWPDGKPGHVYNNNILRMRFKREILPAFAYFYMISPPFRSYLETVKSATTSVAAIYQKSLLKGPFAYPDLDEQKRIVRRIEAAFARIDRLTDEATRAAHLVDRLDERLLAKAFAGELVPQDPNDEPAEALLSRIRKARAAAPKPTRGRKKKAAAE
jgi:type I restriction enzyme, S subunit